ncbi:hypothetical protein Tco_0369561 [Tanacetum coccineum]
MICKPKSFYDEKNKVAIGYKNPLYLTRAKQVQPALYNGHVLVMSNHARPVVHDSEDTRDMAEITRKRMMEKMKSPLYENDRKKAETSVPKPLSALTVYPPNTPVKLVPRVLPTKSQITRASTNEQTSSLLTQIEDLKAQLEGNLKVATRSSVKTKVLAPGMYAIDVKPIPHPLKNNRSGSFKQYQPILRRVLTVREFSRGS